MVNIQKRLSSKLILPFDNSRCSLRFGDIVKDLQVKALQVEGRNVSQLVEEKKKVKEIIFF